MNTTGESTTSKRRVNTVGVRFSSSGRTLLCDAGSLQLAIGAWVVVDDRRSGALARVSVASAPRAIDSALPRLIRVATATDLARLDADRKREEEALTFARECARARGLGIKIFRAEWNGRGDKALFTFASEQRVDFRELVRDLASRYRVRIEMRQVGVRDEAKMVGGIGTCGRELCCTTFLQRFEPISIKMAKHQNLALNPTKVSGQCGRLKCCLVYEEALYVEASKTLPKLGKLVETPDGQGRVQDLDILGGRVRVHFPDRPPQVYPAADVARVAPPGARRADEPSEDDEPSSNGA